MKPPYYSDDWITLYHDDCRCVLPDLEPVDVTVTDPPYSEKVHTSVRPQLVGIRSPGADARRITELGFVHLDAGLRRDASAAIARLTRRWVLVFSDIESTHLWRDDLSRAGLDYVRTGAWVRVNTAPQFSGDRPANGFEAITICHPKGPKRWNGGGKPAVWSVPIVLNRGGTGQRLHTAQKPDRLMNLIIDQFSEPGETVLDPFAGSGATLMAAAMSGRKSIGIEVDERNCEIIARRLTQTFLPFDDGARPND